MNVKRGLVFGLMTLLVGTTLPAFGDVQSSVRRLLPATVAVQWTGHDQTEDEAAYEDVVDDVLKLSLDEGDSGEVSLTSGMVVAENGLIITAHLSPEPGDIEVVWMDGRRLPATIVVHDRRTDLQLLRVDANGLAKVDLRQDAVELAQQVVTVTCTDLRERAAGTGIVTTLNLPLGDKAADVLRTDIHTGPMSAGAPLGDMEGRVAGIIVAKQSESTREDGPALVVPASYAQAILSAYNPASEDVVVLQRGWLGIQLNDDDEEVEHPYIAAVFEQSPAKVGKLQQGDNILKLWNEKPDTASDVVRILGHSHPGENVDVIVDRGGDEIKLTVELGEYPEPVSSNLDFNLSLVHPHRLLVVGKDGKVQHVEGEDVLGYYLGVPNFDVEIKAADPDAKSPEGNIRNLNELVFEIAPSDLFVGDGATIQVKRSDIEEQLSEVSEQVRALAEQVKGLAETLEKLNAKLKK